MSMILTFIWLFIACTITDDGSYITSVTAKSTCSIQSEIIRNNIEGFNCRVSDIVDVANFSNFISIISFPDSLFRSSKRLTIIIFPPSLTSIGDYAFYHCDNLKGPIDFGNVTTVGNSAFRYCSSLTNVNIGNVKYISENAFRDCENLAGPLNLSSVITLGSRAFGGCSKLVGNLDLISLTMIKDHAFEGCYFLNNLTLSQPEITFESYAFQNITNITTLYPIKFSSSMQSNLSGITITYLGSIIPSGSSDVYKKVKAIYVCQYRPNTLYNREVIRLCNISDIRTNAEDDPYIAQENLNNQQFNMNKAVNKRAAAFLLLSYLE